MSATRKHWTEIGRVKNSRWFRALPDFERQAVLAAVEEDTLESSRAFTGGLALFYTTAIYTVALLAWGSVFHLAWLAIVGLVFGLLAGAVCRSIVAQQKTPADLKAIASVMGLVVGLPGVVAAGTGMVAWALRAFVLR